MLQHFRNLKNCKSKDKKLQTVGNNDSLLEETRQREPQPAKYRINFLLTGDERDIDLVIAAISLRADALGVKIGQLEVDECPDVRYTPEEPLWESTESSL